jgi:quercetin dioxygenase-like cupin family protein
MTRNIQIEITAGTDMTMHTENDTSENGPEAVIFRSTDNPFEIPAGNPHFEARNVGVDRATDGAYTVKIFRARQGGAVPPAMHWHDATFQYVHILQGEIEFELADGRKTRLKAGDAIYQPGGCRHCVTWLSEDLELLEVFAPANISTIRVQS